MPGEQKLRERVSVEFQRCRGQERSVYEREVVGEKKIKGRENVPIFPPLPVVIQIPFFKMPFSIHLLSFGYSIFSPLNASCVPTCCPCFSTYRFSPSCLFFLFHSYCLKPISQIGSRGPVSQHLTWECPGRGPGCRQSQVRGVSRDSIPASAQCFLEPSSPRGCRKGPWRELYPFLLCQL